MTTERPRIQAYLDEELYERFKKWKREHGIKKDSEALNGLLAEYFGVSQFPIPNSQSPTVDELRILIQEELRDSGKQNFIEGIKLEAQAMIAQQIAESKSFWQAAGDSFREMLERQQVQIQALEKRIEALISVSDLPSEPLGELGNNALARRLGVNGSTVLKNRDKPTFEEWTRGKDPDAIAWKYDDRLKLFIPLGAS